MTRDAAFTWSRDKWSIGESSAVTFLTAVRWWTQKETHKHTFSKLLMQTFLDYMFHGWYMAPSLPHPLTCGMSDGDGGDKRGTVKSLAASFFRHLLLIPVFLLFEFISLLIHMEAPVSWRAVHTNDYLPIELHCLNRYHCIYMRERADNEENSLNLKKRADENCPKSENRTIVNNSHAYLLSITALFIKIIQSLHCFHCW